MADSGISQTATLEEQEAYLVRLRGRYTQFLNNNPSLQDPLVREQYKALGPEYLKHAPLAIPSSSLVFSTRITDSAVLRMLKFEETIARYQKAVDERKLETAKREESVQPGASSEPNEGRRRGPTPDYEKASRVAGVVARVAPALPKTGLPYGEWRSKLEDILMALDDDGIPTPKTWGPKHGYRNWYAAVAADTAERGRHMAIEAIKYRLKLAEEKPTETIP